MRYAAAIEKLFALQARGMRMGIERMRDALRFRGLTELGAADRPGRRHQWQRFGVRDDRRRSWRRPAIAPGCSPRRTCTASPSASASTVGRSARARRRAAANSCWRRSPDAAAPEVSFFELSTLLAVEAFRDHGCQVAVIEVGLGGRLDATTALPAQLSVITRIALDHTQLLGDTLPKIAREKAGIIRRGVPVIVGAREPSVLRAIGAQARRMAAPMRLVDR